MNFLDNMKPETSNKIFTIIISLELGFLIGALLWWTGIL